MIHDSGTTPTLYFRAYNNDHYAKIIGYNSAGGGNQGDLAFFTEYNNTDTERMRILNTGNVGIGTTSPGTNLHVRKDVVGIWTAVFTGTNDYGVYIGQRDTETYGTIQATQYGVGNNVNLAINALGGNVGIGTAAPAVTLHVNGEMRVSNMNLGTNQGTYTVCASSLGDLCICGMCP